MSNDQLPPQLLRSRAIRGTLLLIIRKFVLRGIGYVTFLFIISKILSQEELGLFGIVYFAITFFGFFSDSGLGASLIQRKQIDARAEQTTFFLQQIIVFFLIIVSFAIAPIFAQQYNLGSTGVLLLRILALSLFFASLKTIPMIRLERALHFQRIIIPEIVEVISYQTILITALLQGVGVMSFAYAIIGRGVLGVLAMYIVSPWKPRFSFSLHEAKTLFRFGLPYQSNYFIALLKDAVTPWFVGKVIGMGAVGLLNWAFQISKFPIEFISDVFRVTFPAYARIQDRPGLLRRAIERSMKYTNILLIPGVVLVIVLIRPFEQLLYAGKWVDAIPAVYIHSFGILFFGMISTCTNALWALGRVRDGVIFMLFSTIVNWSVAIPLVFLIGYNGAMIASTVVLITSLPLAIYLLRRHVRFDFWSQTWPSFTAGAVSGVVVWTLARYGTSFASLIFLGGVGVFVYVGCLFLIERERLIRDIQWFIAALRPVAPVPPPSQEIDRNVSV